MEPMTLFSRIVDPAGVACLLRERVPTVHIDGRDDDWRNATVFFGDQKLIFTHDPAYYAEPNWSVQMNGMRNYFERFPVTDRKDIALMLPTSFKFSLGLLFDPDYAPSGDPRLDVVAAVTELLDGVLFTPSAVRDAHGRVLYGAAGDEDEDPDAVWPKVLAEVTILPRDEQVSTNDVDDAAEAPTPERVARRALALTAVTARAILEQGNVDLQLPATNWIPHNWFRGLLSSNGRQQKSLIAWIENLGIGDDLEPDEWEVVQRPFGRLDPSQQINSTWRLEGLGVLAWALGRFEITPHDQLVECHSLWRSLGLLDLAACKSLLTQPMLRPRQELQQLQNRLFALHWRLNNQRIHPQVIDFKEFARTAWFGPLDISDLPLIDGDLAINGDRLDHATPDAFGCASSAAMERHLAINWLCQGPERYSEASADT